MKNKWYVMLTVSLLSVLSLLSGCAEMGQVKPWEKNYLAKAEMRFDQDKLQAKNTEHIYTSKEAASGGTGVGGGGCGCN